MELIKSHKDLKVYQQSFEMAMEIFQVTKKFPKEETYSLTDQIRRSSRSVCSNVTEAFRRRKYIKSFASKLNESEAEAAETQNWLDFALACKYIEKEIHQRLYKEYDNILGMLVNMQKKPEKWQI
ncbi:MAG: four helix bundle protein [Bacteroidota bacterium]